MSILGNAVRSPEWQYRSYAHLSNSVGPPSKMFPFMLFGQLYFAFWLLSASMVA